MKSFAFVAITLVGGLAAAGGAGPIDLATLDMCALVPGSEVAAAVGATLGETRRFNSPDGDIARCVYIISPTGDASAQPRAIAVELEPEVDFTDVRPYVEEPTHDVEGLGDGAWTFRDPDTGRFRLFVLRRGVATLYLTSADEADLRSVAELVLSKL